MAEFSGHLSLQASVRENGRTALAAQAFRAPYHLSKPYWDEVAKTLLVQVVNPTAGILSGDRLESKITVDSNAALLVTTPSASRVFQMKEGLAVCRQHFAVARGGWLEVMPEPLVPHRGSNFRQTTSVEIERGGELFYVDQLMAGRVAHGETWVWHRLCLALEVHVAGELVVRERFDQRGEDLRELARLSGSGPEACFANAILISDALDSESSWRSEVAALHGNGLWVGVSALRKGGWSLKLIASDSVRLRSGLREMRGILSGFYPRLKCDPRKL